MTVPETKLELNVDLERLTLEDVAVFDPEMAQQNMFGWINKLRHFLLDHSSTWTAEEINRLEIGELQPIANQVMEALKRVATPLAKSKRLRTGRAARAKATRPAG